MAKRERLMQLCDTKGWIPIAQGKDLAIKVYREYSGNWNYVESLMRLSYAVREDIPPETQRVLPRDCTEVLINKEYLERQIGSTALRLTTKGEVAVNLVVPDIDIDRNNFYGEIQEPFIGYTVLGNAIAQSELKREMRRQRDMRQFV